MTKLILSLSFFLLSFFTYSQSKLDTSKISFQDSTVTTIDFEMSGTMVFPFSKPMNFYLLDSEGNVLKYNKDVTIVSFDVENLKKGFYYMVLENESNTDVYKLIK